MTAREKYNFPALVLMGALGAVCLAADVITFAAGSEIPQSVGCGLVPLLHPVEFLIATKLSMFVHSQCSANPVFPTAAIIMFMVKMAATVITASGMAISLLAYPSGRDELRWVVEATLRQPQTKKLGWRGAFRIFKGEAALALFAVSQIWLTSVWLMQPKIGVIRLIRLAVFADLNALVLMSLITGLVPKLVIVLGHAFQSLRDTPT
ncbi:MAG: hypothetical protein EPO08_16440 [Rhodospirillaceae bacterium]|nr:MAG: hypothetical protein EPO08_16440 [Rhodospirillaceae bacterium]